MECCLSLSHLTYHARSESLIFKIHFSVPFISELSLSFDKREYIFSGLLRCEVIIMANKFLLFAIVLAAMLSAANCQRQAQCCEEYCYELDNERPQSAHFGTKTAYQIIKGSEAGRQYIVPSKRKIFGEEKFSNRIQYKNVLNFSDCNPVKIWMLSRHGTKLPNARSLERLKALEFVS